MCGAKCTADNNCASGNYCVVATGLCAPKGGVGDACAGNNQCSNNNCTSGVCCGSTCTLGCQACSTALTGQANGTCAPKLVTTSTATAPLCGAVCPPGYQQCAFATLCSRIAWNFEPPPGDPYAEGEWLSGSNSNWGRDAFNYTTAADGRVRSGTNALRIRANSPPSLWWMGGSVNMCPNGGTMDLHGKAATFWFYFDGPSADLFATDNGCKVIAYGEYNPNTMTYPTLWEAPINPQFGKWYSVTSTVGSAALAVTTVSMSCTFTEWSGTLYMDDVSFK
jgi:hypothetical protein